MLDRYLEDERRYRERNVRVAKTKMSDSTCFNCAIVATASHCTPDRQTGRRSVCKSLQLLLYNRTCRRREPVRFRQRRSVGTGGFKLRLFDREKYMPRDSFSTPDEDRGSRGNPAGREIPRRH
ncbi:hypothetical protein GRS80_06405 [Natrialba sp. INN-245]|nr:hypothetical protein [Natrialba sp. INN-245]